MLTLTTEERHEIAQRLAEIKAQTDAIHTNPSPGDERLIADFDRETTDLLRRLSESDAG